MIAFLVALMGLVVMFLSSADLRNSKEKAEKKLVSPALFVAFWLDGFVMIICAACLKFILY